MEPTIKFKLLRENAVAPSRATDGSAGFDFYWCPQDPKANHPALCDRWIDNARKWENVSPSIILETGVACAIPAGFVGLVFSRSGHGFKNNIRLANCVGVIDSDYRGELKVKLTIDGGTFIFEQKDKICQMVVVPCVTAFEVVQDLGETERGDKGYGSSGR